MSKNILLGALLYGLLMNFIILFISPYPILLQIKSSSVSEIFLVVVFFWIFGIFSLYTFSSYFLIASKQNKTFKTLSNVFFLLVIAMFATEIFNIYWIAIKRQSDFLSGIFSALFFSPFAILLGILIQKISISLFNTSKKSTSVNFIKEKVKEEKLSFIKSSTPEENLYCYKCISKLGKVSWQSGGFFYCDKCAKNSC